MKTHSIDLRSMLSHGQVVTDIDDDGLHFTLPSRLTTEFMKPETSVRSYLYLPDAYKLPLRIDLTVQLDAPGFYVFLGDGHLNFGTPWSDNRRIDDLVEPTYKPRFFHNHLPLNEFADISIIYDLNAMQILINGEERFYSEKERYMRSKRFLKSNDNGFMLKFACDKNTHGLLKSLRVTEYEGNAGIVHTDSPIPEPITRNEAVPQGEKPTLKTCISLLPSDIREEILKTDAFLRALSPMKFKRTIDKYGHKVTYCASEHGFSYALHPSNDMISHTLSWYIITSSKPELWHRKADNMEATLDILSVTSPELAERLFRNLRECIACTTPCAVRTPYTFGGEKKVTCHGLMDFGMRVGDFEDVRMFIDAANGLASESKQQ